MAAFDTIQIASVLSELSCSRHGHAAHQWRSYSRKQLPSCCLIARTSSRGTELASNCISSAYYVVRHRTWRWICRWGRLYIMRQYRVDQTLNLRQNSPSVWHDSEDKKDCTTTVYSHCVLSKGIWPEPVKSRNRCLSKTALRSRRTRREISVVDGTTRSLRTVRITGWILLCELWL